MTSPATTARPKPFADPSSVDTLVDRMPPHDLVAEAAVLGSILKNGECLGGVRIVIPRPEMFFRDENQEIYRALCEIQDARKPIDPKILYSTLKTKNMLDYVGGAEYIRELTDSVPSAARAEYYAAFVYQKSVMRGVIIAATATLRDVYESGEHEVAILERAQDRFHRLSEARTVSYPTPMSDIVVDLIEVLDKKEEREKLTGLMTGFTELDNLTGGLMNGDLIIVAARPSVGKTAFATNVVEHVGVKWGATCALFSLEMKKQAIAMRMLCSKALIDSHKLKRGELTEAERRRLINVVSEVATPNIFIDDTPGIGLSEVRTKMMRLKERHNLKLAAIDYLGLMRAERAENRNQEISKMSLGVKNLAREIDIPILLLSQLNRDCETEGRIPRKSDLRDSGSIEQDADMIILLHREICYHRGDKQWIDANPDKVNEALAILDKQRNGPTDTIRLTYLDQQTRFVNHYQQGIL